MCMTTIQKLEVETCDAIITLTLFNFKVKNILHMGIHTIVILNVHQKWSIEIILK